ncbi:MAG: DUF3795 domain-containing protein [Desulfarculus sp.]|jgi:hypothetical protein|nr:MAG: DUF3795 domain-containing protein [Desulfarculus sp.]
MKLACCGNDCAICPRYTATQSGDEELLRQAAETWLRVGWRDVLAAPQDMACHGCQTAAWCRYGIRDCAQQLKMAHCGQCRRYPCPRLRQAFARSAAYAEKCRRLCSPQEYAVLAKAFFSKQENLARSRRG